jgi:ferrous iron transport protein A
LLQPGEWADVTEVTGDARWIGRMAELGIRTGTRLRLLRAGSPCLMQVGACRLSLRPEMAVQILVRPLTASEVANLPVTSPLLEGLG